MYLYDTVDHTKHLRAQELVLDDSVDLVISAQVLNEFYVTLTRKILVPMSHDQATRAVEALAELEFVPLTRNLVVDALRTDAAHQLSHWDALIVEAASRAGTSQLFTEDLQSGATLSGVTIVNPFDG